MKFLQMMSTDTCSLGLGHVEVPTNESSEVHVPHSSPRCDDVSASSASAIEGQSVVIVGVKEHNGQVSADDATEVDPSVHVGSREFINKSSEHSTILGEQYEFIPDEDDRGHPFGVENVTELDVGYDSQIEDGELRQSIAPTWEENETEDGEAERVDYESDDRDMYDFDVVDYLDPMMEFIELIHAKINWALVEAQHQ